MKILISLLIVEFVVDICTVKKMYDYFALLNIIHYKKVDVLTYIINTDNYDDYLFEISGLIIIDEFILTRKEYDKLKKFFK